jgi:catechol 2,3-dioxygenase-like lactoylglutathione lyase family enzyme
MLPTPGFHHPHLNSADPDAAIDFYVRQFPTSSKGEWGGLPALLTPNDCMILFDKVDRPPVSGPQSAIWHFGRHVPDARATLETFKSRPEVKPQLLYTTDEGGSVLINSETWPNVGGLLGLAKAPIQRLGRLELVSLWQI